MVLLLLLGMPIAFALAFTGFVGMVYLLGLSTALPQLHLTLYPIVSNYNFTVLPFFVLMGYFADVSGISKDLYMTAEKWLRRLPGGLALATIAGCAGFAAISGSSVATAATMGSVALPEMRRHNYDGGLAAGTIAAGGTLGFLIPPSVAFVVYGIIAEQSVGRLLISGILPGILLALSFMAIVIFRVKMNPKLAPVSLETVSWREKFLSLKDIWGVVVVFVVVMGGMYFGFFTATEAGAVGAFVLFLFAIGKKKLSRRVLLDTLAGTAGTICMIFVTLFGAMLFSDFLALSQIPMALAAAIGGLALNRYVVFALIIVLYLILGCFVESIPMMILVTPIVLPILVSLGFDPVWFGVISVLMVEAALITPPVGLNVYVIGGMAKDIPMMAVFRGAVPFVIAIIIVVIILAAFPDIALILPRIMIG